MSGACPLSSVGAGYIIVDPNEPDVTIKETLGLCHVCVRESATWKEIVATCKHHLHAMALKDVIDSCRSLSDKGRKRSL